MDPKLVNLITVNSRLDWDEYFMLQAMMASFKSKDPHTKVGCILVDENNHHLSMGYNGMIAGIDEKMLPWGNDRTVPLEFQKYGYVVHAEANAISHAKSSLRGARIYVTLFPCHECAKQLANHRIAEVVYLCNKYADTEDFRMSSKILDLSGIKYRQLAMNQELIDDLHDYLTELTHE